jgi:hypothetical protein
MQYIFLTILFCRDWGVNEPLFSANTWLFAGFHREGMKK